MIGSGTVVNVVTVLLGCGVGVLAGHSAIRTFVMGEDATEREGTFTLTTTPRDMQRRALKLLANIAL